MCIRDRKKIVDRHMTLKEFTIQAISKGSDDVGKVHMQVEYDNQIYYGFGANTCLLYTSSSTLPGTTKLKNEE